MGKEKEQVLLVWEVRTFQNENVLRERRKEEKLVPLWPLSKNRGVRSSFMWTGPTRKT
jgi:hypothetical protein